ncbi:serine/threonine-protein kinase [Pseudonocardia cypriaca]|uniref:non-specific serine/threonine protein kinase n=1 Tax=Pseudonocardia cypriaca TaxID=882449 RepID=A0A543FQN5_9PSEU|nr:serine/threonine-protein kinase [Pseudonocardia cypriaca]TQM36054.1 serine/threonine-protein kinase [Pseudonocardia cypriaca]
MTVLAAGQKIDDRYLLERRIAVGGMGEVWEASDTRLGRGVAVKVLRPELGDDPEFLHRFRIEARTVASLDNPGIAAVHDYGEDEAPNGRRTAYLVMELVRGEPLSTIIARGPIDADETLRLIEDAAWALQAAHERGFVHRDVKPGNILVRTDGVVKLTDFGIAKAADAVPVTRSGMVMGTAHYIAPEQASGAEAGPASDVYSLGIVGYECLAGQRPFRADSAVAVAMMQVREAPPPLPSGIPRGARELIEAALVKDPAKRYGTGGEFAMAVAAVRRGEPLPAVGSMTGTITPPRSPSTPSRAAPKTAPRAAPPSAPFPASSPLSAPIPTRSTPPRQARPVPPAPKSAPRPARPAPAPARRHGPDTPNHRRPQPTPARHTAKAPPASRASSQSFQLQPKSSGRTLLLVLFVLLTIAAVVVGVLLFRGGLPPIGAVNPTPQGAGPGTVTGQEGIPGSSAVPGGLLSLVIVTGSAR